MTGAEQGSQGEAVTVLQSWGNRWQAVAGPRTLGWLHRDCASPSGSQGWALELLSSDSSYFGKRILLPVS